VTSASGPKVLAAFDFGEPALEALRQARELAHGMGGSLAACHVLPPDPDFSLLFPGRSLDVTAGTATDDVGARKALEERARSELGLELTELFIERGSAYAEIVRRAETWGAGLVVVGSHGRTGVARTVLGSVAERVVRHAHCSVLVARPSPKKGVVIAATDLSDPSLAAIVAGRDAAKRIGARLVVVSAIEWTGFAARPSEGLIGALPPLPPAELQREMNDALRSMLETAMARCAAVGEARVLNGSAASAIVSCAGELGASLVVVATHGRTGLKRLALGSVAELVVRGAECSVLAVRTA
jgi:nucleotide-binding universal stress UspA family protein